MELIERIDLEKINYLFSLSYADLDIYFKKCKTKEDKKIEFDKIKSFCLTNIKTKGVRKRIYSKPASTPGNVDNRLYSGGSIQSLPKAFRSFFMEKTTYDVDMANCHPCILAYICKSNNINCAYLYEYLANRDAILGEFPDRNEAKTAFLSSVNCDTFNKKIKNNFFKNFDKEMGQIHQQILKLPQYQDIIKSVPSDKKYNRNGSAINRILCSYENQILGAAISFNNQQNIEIAVLMFDGLMPYKKFNEESGEEIPFSSDYLLALTQYVEGNFPSLNMQWAFKDQTSDIQIPEGWTAPEQGIDQFKEMVTDFEKRHALITEQACYILDNGKEVIYLSKSQMIVSYEHIKYKAIVSTDEGEKIVKKQFITNWITHEDKRQFNRVSVYPNAALCPSDIYNLWRPFAYDLYTGAYEKDEEGMEFILNHFKILSNHDAKVTEYFIKWTARMIQYPELKSTAPVFTGDEGCGKGSYVDMMEVFLGNDKVLRTAQPGTHVWGTFNPLMENAFLVNFDELSKRDADEAENYIKVLITEPTIAIHKKGKDPFRIPSFHKFIMTTNPSKAGSGPIATRVGDRRKCLIECSNEMKGDTAYFDKFHEYLKNVNTMRTVWDYLKTLPDVKDIVMPLTDFQKNIQEANRNIEEQFIIDFTMKHISEAGLNLTNEEFYSAFSTWYVGTNMKSEFLPSSISFGLKIANSKFKQCITKVKSNGTRKNKIDITALKELFQICDDEEEVL